MNIHTGLIRNIHWSTTVRYWSYSNIIGRICIQVWHCLHRSLHRFSIPSHKLSWQWNHKNNHATNPLLTQHKVHHCHRSVGTHLDPSSWRPVLCLNDPIPKCFYLYLLWHLSKRSLLKLYLLTSFVLTPSWSQEDMN